MKKSSCVVFAGVVMCLAVVVGAAAARMAPPETDPGQAAQQSGGGLATAYDQPDFRAIVHKATARVFPAVVFIRCLQETHAAGERLSREVTGSGVIINSSGEVITNWHVVENALKVRCLLSDGRAFDAEIVGTDKSTDLALLQLQTAGESNLPYATFGDSAVLSEGDFVMAMGAPWGLNRSVSIGIVSCTRRYLDEVSEYSLWLQTDAAINPGNSGGPLVNTEGGIIGINARGMSMGDGMGFAIPSETVKLLLPQLRDNGKVNWSWSGLQLQPLRDFRRDIYFAGSKGVIVAQTDPESPARRAGLQPRDRILSINGEKVTALTEEDLPWVRRQIALLPMHEPAAFEIRRGDRTMLVEIAPREKGTVEGRELDLPRWDFTVKEINQFENPELYFHRREGVFVYGIKYPGNAVKAGLASNDIVLKVDGQSVTTLDEVKHIHKDAIDNIRAKHRMIIVVLRNGLMRQIVLDFSRDHAKD